MRGIRSRWPRVEILIRADSHYCAPEVLDFCRAERLDFVLGVAATTTLRPARRGAGAEHRYPVRRRRRAATSSAATKQLWDGAGSWSRVERIIAHVEAGPQGTDTRFVVTNLADGTPRRIYEDLYCARGLGRKPHQGLEVATSLPIGPRVAAPPPTSFTL